MAQQQARWMTAKDTFVITLPDGADHCVTKGAMRMSNHVLVQAAPGLWQDADPGEADELPQPKSAAKAEPEPKAAAPVKPAPAGRGKAG